MREQELEQILEKTTGNAPVRAVIISGGTVEREHALEVLNREKYNYVIGADKGLAFLYRENIEPTHIVGDFDSLEQGILEHYMENPNVVIRIFNPIKDSTDTEIAIRLAMELGSDEIVVLGANGARVDHTLANIQTLAIPAGQGIHCVLEDAHNRIELLTGGCTFSKEQAFGKYVSFFPLGGCVEELTLEGVKYPLHKHSLTPYNSLGVSNEIVEDRVSVTFRKGLLIMVMTRD